MNRHISKICVAMPFLAAHLAACSAMSGEEASAGQEKTDPSEASQPSDDLQGWRAFGYGLCSFWNVPENKTICNNAIAQATSVDQFHFAGTANVICGSMSHNKRAVDCFTAAYTAMVESPFEDRRLASVTAASCYQGPLNTKDKAECLKAAFQEISPEGWKRTP